MKIKNRNLNFKSFHILINQKIFIIFIVILLNKIQLKKVSNYLFFSIFYVIKQYDKSLYISNI